MAKYTEHKTIQLKDEQLLTIRNATEDDAQTIIHYLNIVGGESDNLTFGPEGLPFTVEQEISYIQNINNDSNSLMLLGCINDQLISIASLNTTSSTRVGHNGDFGITVKKEFWGIGIGAAMTNEIITFAKDHPIIKNIHLGVRAENDSAIKLYKKVGFVKTGVRKDYFHVNGKYYDEILMDLQV